MARTLAEMLSVGEIDRLSWYAYRGYASGHLARMLRDRHPDAAERDIQTVVRRSIAAVGVGALYQHAPDSMKAWASQMPRGPDPAAGFGWTLDVRYRLDSRVDPDTGRPAYETKTVRVSAGENLTWGQIQAAAGQALLVLLTSATGRRPGYEEYETLEISDYTVRAVYRQ